MRLKVKQLKFRYVKKIKSDIIKDPFQDMLRINVVKSNFSS